jgi:hypothetical protein
MGVSGRRPVRSERIAFSWLRWQKEALIDKVHARHPCVYNNIATLTYIQRSHSCHLLQISADVALGLGVFILRQTLLVTILVVKLVVCRSVGVVWVCAKCVRFLSGAANSYS